MVAVLAYARAGAAGSQVRSTPPCRVAQTVLAGRANDAGSRSRALADATQRAARTAVQKSTVPNTGRTGMTVTVGRSADAAAISPFTIETPEADLEDLRARLAATRWPEKETVADDSQGVPLATMRKLARYWATDYDWRRCEAELNALPQFITEIDGLDIHFIHVRSPHGDALPLVVNHGWPGSIIEQLKIIDRLTDPTAHGGSAEDAFDV